MQLQCWRATKSCKCMWIELNVPNVRYMLIFCCWFLSLSRNNDEKLCLILQGISSNDHKRVMQLLHSFSSIELYRLLTSYWSVMFETTKVKRTGKSLMTFSELTESYILPAICQSESVRIAFLATLKHLLVDTSIVNIEIVAKLFMDYLASHFGQVSAYTSVQAIMENLLEAYFYRMCVLRGYSEPISTTSQAMTRNSQKHDPMRSNNVSVNNNNDSLCSQASTSSDKSTLSISMTNSDNSSVSLICVTPAELNWIYLPCNTILCVFVVCGRIKIVETIQQRTIQQFTPHQARRFPIIAKHGIKCRYRWHTAQAPQHIHLFVLQRSDENSHPNLFVWLEGVPIGCQGKNLQQIHSIEIHSIHTGKCDSNPWQSHFAKPLWYIRTSKSTIWEYRTNSSRKWWQVGYWFNGGWDYCIACIDFVPRATLFVFECIAADERKWTFWQAWDVSRCQYWSAVRDRWTPQGHFNRYQTTGGFFFGAYFVPSNDSYNNMFSVNAFVLYRHCYAVANYHVILCRR